MKNISVVAYELLKEQGLEVGSKVKVLTTWPSKSPGFTDASWVDGMNRTVGTTLEVINIHHDPVRDEVRIQLNDSGAYFYPPQVLQFVEKGKRKAVKLNNQYTAKIDYENQIIEVGCQTIPFSKVEELAEVIRTNKK